MADLLPLGQAIDAELGEERLRRYDAAAVGERPQVATLRGGLVDQLERRLRQPGREEAEDDRRPALDREPAQAPLEVAMPFRIEVALGRELEDGVALVADDADEMSNLIPRGEPGGHRPVVGRHVGDRARRREAGRARIQRGAQLGGHYCEIVFGRRLFEGPFAHRPGAQRGVPDRGGVVETLGSRVDGVEELRERRPRPGDALGHRLGRDVLGPFEISHDQRTRVRRARVPG